MTLKKKSYEFNACEILIWALILSPALKKTQVVVEILLKDTKREIVVFINANAFYLTASY